MHPRVDQCPSREPGNKIYAVETHHFFRPFWTLVIILIIIFWPSIPRLGEREECRQVTRTVCTQGQGQLVNLLCLKKWKLQRYFLILILVQDISISIASDMTGVAVGSEWFSLYFEQFSSQALTQPLVGTQPPPYCLFIVRASQKCFSCLQSGAVRIFLNKFSLSFNKQSE